MTFDLYIWDTVCDFIRFDKMQLALAFSDVCFNNNLYEFLYNKKQRSEYELQSKSNNCASSSRLKRL